MVAAAEVVDEHLLDGFVVGDGDVADSAAADEVADFLGEIFGVIAGAFERLGHEDDLQAGLADKIFGILDVAPQSVNIFSSRVAIWVRSRVSSESMRPLTDWALLAKLSSRSPMRSTAIITFMQASSSRASAGPTSVMAVVTPLSISISRVSSSRSRCRSEFSNAVEPVAMPSAAAPAASWAQRHGST